MAAGHIYKLIEVVGTSASSYDEAVKNAVQEAGKSVKNMSWFHVTDMRGSISPDMKLEYQATVKIGFRVEH